MVNLFKPRKDFTQRNATVAILGLGRFGLALGEELVHSGVEVLGVDAEEERVNKAQQIFTHVAVADTTDPEALRQLGVQDASRVVIGIGSDMAASVLTTTAVIEDLKATNVWAKADDPAHALILQRLGVHHVVRPERDTGRRIAHLISGRVEEFVEFDRDYAMAKLAPTVNMLGKSWQDAPPGITVVAIRPPNGSFASPLPEQIIESGDLLIVSGRVQDLEKLGEV